MDNKRGTMPVQSSIEVKLTRSSEDNVEVQAINANGGVVFDTKINVFLNTETEVASVGEVIFPQLVFSDFKTTFKDLFSLGTTDCAVDSNFFITADTKRTNSVSGFREDRLLASELFQDLQDQKRNLLLHFDL